MREEFKQGVSPPKIKDFDNIAKKMSQLQLHEGKYAHHPSKNTHGHPR